MRRPRLVRWLLVPGFVVLGGVIAWAQGSALNTRIKLDSNGYILTSATGAGSPTGQAGSPLANTIVKLDSNGYLLINCQSGCAGAGSLPSSVQGDTIYSSGVNTYVTLPKDTNATRYLSNTGSSNNPAWAQVSLTTGVSGTLPFGSGGTGLTSAGDDTVMVSSGSAWVATSVTNCVDSGGNHLNYTAATNSFSCGTSGTASGPITSSGLTMNTARLLGRTTASSGSIEEIAVGTGLSLSAGTLTATGGSGTPAGSDKQVQFNDGGAFGGDSGLVFDKTANTLNALGTVTGAGFNGTYASKTSVYTASVTDWVIDCTANAFTVNLPTAVGISGRMYIVKNTQTANTCVLDGNGAETIDGASTVAVANGALTIISDGANWREIGSLGVSIGAVAQGDLIYGSGAYTVSLLNKTGSAAILGNSGSSNNPAWQTTIALAPIYLFNAGVCQNVTASIGTSLFTSSTPTARCVTGSNTTFGTAQFTATGQQIQGMLRAPADVSSTTVTISGQFFGETTSSGNTTFTFSFARVANAGTLDPAFTDCSDLTPAAGTANQLNSFSQTCTITGLTAGDLVFWKFRYKTAPTTPGNQDLINLAFIPLRSMTIGG